MTYTSSIADPLGSLSHKFVQIPIALIRKIRSFKLSGTQHALWLLLCELDPFGDRWVNLPSPSEIAEILEVDTRTIERAAHRLSDLGLFDFQVKSWRGKNNNGSKIASKFSSEKGIQSSESGQDDPILDKTIQFPTKRSNSGQPDPNQEPKPLSSEDPKLSHTTTNNQNFKEQQNSPKDPPSHPVVEDEQEKMIDLGGIVKTLTQKGFQPNKTINREIEQQIQKLGGAAAAARVCAAAAAVLEQDHNARNKGGMIVSAIRDGWQPMAKTVVASEFSTAPALVTAPLPIPVDLSDVLFGIDIECDRLGWTRKEAIAHMSEHYGWRPIAFQNLADDDLRALLDELRMQPCRM